MSCNARITPVQRRVLTAILEKNYNQAIKLLSPLLQKHPNNNVLRLYVELFSLNRATCYLEIDMCKECAEDCQEIMSMDPFDLQAVIVYGKALFRLEKWEESMKVLVDGREIHADVRLHRDLESTIQEVSKKMSNNSGAELKKDSKIVEGIEASQKLVSVDPNAWMLEMKKHVLGQLMRSQATCVRIDDKIGLGQMKVNTGNYSEAIAWFTELIENELIEGTKLWACFVGRGSAYALLNDYEKAIRDFSRAVDIDDTQAEAFKRRGQAKAAKGLYKNALRDLTKAAELGTIFKKDHEVYFQRGLIIYHMNQYSKAIADFKNAVALEPRHQNSWNFMGLCSHALGDYKEALDYFEHVLAIDSKSIEALFNAAQSCAELGDTTHAISLYNRVITNDQKHVESYLHRGLMYYKMGLIFSSIDDLSRCVSFSPTHVHAIESLGLSYHANGKFRKAIETYDAALALAPTSRCWFQREIAYFQIRHMMLPFDQFNADITLNCFFKDAYVRKLLSSSISDSYASLVLTNFEDPDFSEDLSASDLKLIKYCESLGKVLNVCCPGVINNVKNSISYGVIIFQLANLILSSLDDSFSLTGAGSSCCKTSHQVGWRDCVDIFVKYRQFAEPLEPTFWLDLLTPELVAEGFALQHPIVNGALKIAKTYPYFQRTFTLVKSLMFSQCALQEKHNLSNASTLSQLYNAVEADFVVVNRINSLKPGFTSAADTNDHDLIDGVSISLIEREPSSFLFTVSTPSTPNRWRSYDAILSDIFSFIVSILQDYRAKQPLDIDSLEEAACLFFYYFVNFGPISHAVMQAGLCFWHAILLAADLEVTMTLPENVMLDWEVYLSSSPFQFAQFIKSIHYPKYVKTSVSFSTSNHFINAKEFLRGILHE